METLFAPVTAAPPPMLGNRAAEDQYVAFRCGATDYCIPIMSVREIRSWQPTTAIPGRNPASRGVLDIRGTVVEVYDLGALLGAPPIEPAPGCVVLVLSLDETLVGVLVDTVSDIIQASDAELMPVPGDAPLSRGRVASMVSRDDRLIALLDLSRVFIKAEARM